MVADTRVVAFVSVVAAAYVGAALSIGSAIADVEDSRAEVVVIGGGPKGLRAAIAAARASGRPVLLMNQGPIDDFEQGANHFMPPFRRDGIAGLARLMNQAPDPLSQAEQAQVARLEVEARELGVVVMNQISTLGLHGGGTDAHYYGATPSSIAISWRDVASSGRVGTIHAKHAILVARDHARESLGLGSAPGDVTGLNVHFVGGDVEEAADDASRIADYIGETRLLAPGSPTADEAGRRLLRDTAASRARSRGRPRGSPPPTARPHPTSVRFPSSQERALPDAPRHRAPLGSRAAAARYRSRSPGRRGR